MPSNSETLLKILHRYQGPPIRLMEVCGTHTRQISYFGIQELLPKNIELISGPGCPVCVTPAVYIDRAVELALKPGCTVLSFGDMLRVPGHRTSLAEARAAGGSVTLMYSPMEVLTRAAKEPERLFVVAAVGFETILPLYALLLQRIEESALENVRLLLAVKALLPVLEWICRNNPYIDGFLGPGHVSSVIGSGCYEPLCARYGIPLTVAGFSYEHLLAALCDLIDQIKLGSAEAHNLYPNAVTQQGNRQALELIAHYFKLETSLWRGFGSIEASGYALQPAYSDYDIGISDFGDGDSEPAGCLCGEVVTGRARPTDCAHFGSGCTPEKPLGPCMVSGEGACGIWQLNGRRR